jgi:hypothetical protein
LGNLFSGFENFITFQGISGRNPENAVIFVYLRKMQSKIGILAHKIKVV